MRNAHGESLLPQLKRRRATSLPPSSASIRSRGSRRTGSGLADGGFARVLDWPLEVGCWRNRVRRSAIRIDRRGLGLACVALILPAALWSQAAGRDSGDISAVESPALRAITVDTVIRYARSMRIDEAVRSALAVSPGMAAATGALRVGRSGERVAYGEFLPGAGINSLAFQSGQHSLFGSSAGFPYPTQSYSAALAASYDLFTGGRRIADVRAARATLRSADASLLQERYAVTLLAKQTFYAVRRASDLVRVSTSAVTTADRAEQYADSRMRRGTATRADVLLARLNATNARQQLIAARDTLATNAYLLGRLVGVAGAVSAEGGDSLPAMSLAVSDSAIIDLATRSGPAVRAADEFARATDAAVRAAQSQYLPDIKLTGGYTWANNSVAYSAVRPGWLVEVGTSYPLFNGFLREDNVTRASANAKTANVEAADERRFARAEAERLLTSLRLAWESIGQTDEAVRVAAENLRVVSIRYQNGVATFLDLSTAQLAQAQADVALVTARYNYLTSRAALEALVGREL